MKNAHLDEDGIMQIDWDTCNNCGKCVDACNFDCVTEAKAGYKIMVGGIWGKRQRLGTVIDEIYTKEQVFEMIERALLLYREQGKTGERFGVFIRKSGPQLGVEAPDRNLLCILLMVRRRKSISLAGSIILACIGWASSSRNRTDSSAF